MTYKQIIDKAVEKARERGYKDKLAYTCEYELMLDLKFLAAFFGSVWRDKTIELIFLETDEEKIKYLEKNL